MEIVILFGPPGVGKGTQADLLAKETKYKHLSTGEALRATIKENSVLGKEIEKLIAKGLFASDEIIAEIVEAFLEEHKNSKGFIFDGFPRNVKQAELLNKFLTMKKLGNATIINLAAQKRN
jgi:adenylate kinase